MTEYTEASPRLPQASAAGPPVPVTRQINVGGLERVLSLLGGGALVLYGMRRSLGHMLLMLGGGALMYRGLKGYCPAYQAMGINTVDQGVGPGVLLDATITVNKPAADVYRFWQRTDNLPRFMSHLDAVVSVEGKRSRWSARGPLHLPITWDADLIEERPHTMLAWRSLPGARLDFLATVRLRELPDGRGTETRLRLEYAPPGGVAGVALARLFKTLTLRQLKEDLRHFKQLIEAGETPTAAAPAAAAAGQRAPAERGAGAL